MFVFRSVVKVGFNPSLASTVKTLVIIIERTVHYTVTCLIAAAAKEPEPSEH